MNYKEYKVMIMEVIESLNHEIYGAAERNSHKDILVNYPDQRLEYCKGWSTYWLAPKLEEELKELKENPSPKEIGDVVWVLAMMLDQILTSTSCTNNEVKKDD